MLKGLKPISCKYAKGRMEEQNKKFIFVKEFEQLKHLSFLFYVIVKRRPKRKYTLFALQHTLDLAR